MLKRKSILSLLFSISLLTFGLSACGEISQGDSSVNPDDTEQNDNNDSNNNQDNTEQNDNNDGNVEEDRGTFTNPIEVTIQEANDIASNLKNDTLSEEYYKCSGTVTQLKIEPKETKFVLNNASQNIQVYYIENINDYPRLANGDEVTIVSKLKNYNNHKEFHRARITNAIHNTPEEIRNSINENLFNDASIPYKTIPELISLANALPQDNESEGSIDKYYVKGFINEIINNSSYHHIKLGTTKEASNSDLLFVNVGKDTYNELETKFEVNDEIILYGSLRHTNNGPQMYRPEIKALRVHD